MMLSTFTWGLYARWSYLGEGEAVVEAESAGEESMDGRADGLGESTG